MRGEGGSCGCLGSAHNEPVCLAGVGMGCACAGPARTVARALRGGGAQLELVGVRDAVHAAQGHVGHLHHAHQAGRLRTEPVPSAELKELTPQN